MEWLATAIRTYKGQASVVQVQGFDDLPAEQLKRLFVETSSRDYQKLTYEAKRLLALPPARRPIGTAKSDSASISGTHGHRLL